MMLIRLLITLLVLTPFFSIVNIEAMDQATSVIIEEYEEDLTGDGRKDTILLKGYHLSKNSHFYQAVWLEIIDEDDNQWRIDYGGAYDPTIMLVDLNHNHIPYLLFKKSLDEHGQTVTLLQSLINDEVQEMTVPKHNYISGAFQDDFIVNLQMFPHRQPIVIEVTQYATKYIEENIYTKDGKVKNQRKITVPQTDYEPIYISKAKGFGLKSNQSIYGIDRYDELGKVESIWYLEENEWRQLRTRFIPIEEINVPSTKK